MKRALAFAAVSFLALGLVAVRAAEPSLLMRVARKNADDLAMLRAAGIPVVMEMRPCLFVLGGPLDLAALGARGYDAKIVDRDPAKSDYLVVGLRPDSDVAALRAAGSMLLAEENWQLLRVPAGTIPDTLHDAKVFVGHVPKEPVSAPRPVPDTQRNNAVLVANPIVQEIVSTVADADIQAYWQAIVSNPPLATRYSTNQGCRDASTYCFNAYSALKIPAQYQNWSVGNAPNVIGTLTGATRPGDVYIVIAHLDDLPSSGTAPGANDNGSGSAAVLTSAKALSCWGVRNTVKFLNVTGEEQGLFGSDAYAADAATRGENIRGVINYDMIGWAGDGIPAVENLDLNYNTPSQWLAQRFVDAAANYGTGLTVNTILCPSLTVSDHYPFWQRGWSAICGITDNEGYCGAAGNYPPYHTSGDTMAANGNLAFFYKVVKTTVATLAELGDPFKVTFGADGYACGAPIQVILADGDLNTAAGTTQTVGVHVWSTSEPAGETLTLTERGTNSMLFDGSMATTAAPPVTGDGFLSVAAGDVLHVDYVDALDCDGGTNVAYAATAVTDCLAPIITNVQLGAIGGNSAQITWDTNEPANSGATYGTTPPPGTPGPVDPALTTTHNYTLTGLSTCTPYVVAVNSADGWGNAASDNNGGSYYTFTTGANISKNVPYVGAPVPIPDNNPAGGTSIITVPDNKVISDVNVTIGSITHTYDSDIVVHLIGPDNTDVILANHRGASGDNFTNTVFDDAAATPIASGAAPFTGTFIPDAPLAAFNGKVAAGAWKLFVVDSVGQDSGQIIGWTLNFTLAQTCAPHAIYGAHALVADTCSGGGAGNGNGSWDAGEQVQFNVQISNDGAMPLTGVTASLTSSTPGVVVTDGLASYADLPAGASGNAIAPFFSATLPQDLACGGSVGFDVTIQSTQGSWVGSFSHTVGTTLPGGGTALDESFASGIPASWSIVDGGSGTGAAATWTTANPGARALTAPLASPAAIVDSDFAGTGISQDEQLITPVMNLTTATTVTLQFDQFFRWYNQGQAELGDVDVRSTLTGGLWVNVLRNQGASSADPDHKTLNISAQAAGAATVQVRFHYYQATYEWYWLVDNVKVTYTAPGGCQMSTCLAPSAPPPVPDGTSGTAMHADRSAGDGSTITLHWDVSGCTGSGYKAVYGSLGSLPTYTVSGAACALGTSGTATWSAVPAGDLWYVVVATDGAGTEGTWGNASSGPCGGTTASAQCGDTLRNNAGTCP